MTYRRNSGWNDKNELRCLLIMRKLQKEGSPRGRQTQYCKEMAELPDVKPGKNSIRCKIGNFQSLDGIGSWDKFSSNTKRIYEKYKKCSVEELERIIAKL